MSGLHNHPNAAGRSQRALRTFLYKRPPTASQLLIDTFQRLELCSRDILHLSQEATPERVATTPAAVYCSTEDLSLVLNYNRVQYISLVYSSIVCCSLQQEYSRLFNTCSCIDSPTTCPATLYTMRRIRQPCPIRPISNMPRWARRRRCSVALG